MRGMRFAGLVLAVCLSSCDCGKPRTEDLAAEVEARLASVRLPPTTDPGLAPLGHGLRVVVGMSAVSVDDALVSPHTAFAAPDVVRLEAGLDAADPGNRRSFPPLVDALNRAAEGHRTGDVHAPLAAWLLVDRNVPMLTVSRVLGSVHEASLAPRMAVRRGREVVAREEPRARSCEGAYASACARPTVEFVVGGLSVRAVPGPSEDCVVIRPISLPSPPDWSGRQLVPDDATCPSVPRAGDGPDVDSLVALLERIERLAPGCVVGSIEPADDTALGDALAVVEAVQRRTSFQHASLRFAVREARPLPEAPCDDALVLDGGGAGARDVDVDEEDARDEDDAPTSRPDPAAAP